MKNLHVGHRKRVKHRFLKSGLSSFDKHNILEFLLFYSIPRKDTNELSHNLINHFGSFSSVFDASFEELIKVDGISESTAILIKLVPSITAEYLKDKSDNGIILYSTKVIGDYLKPFFLDKNRECVYCVCLDNKLKVIKTALMFEGNVNAVSLVNRKVIEFVTANNASTVIIAHNHPNGLAIPSESDIITTNKLKEALALIDVRLLDHIIISDNDFVSFAESELL